MHFHSLKRIGLALALPLVSGAVLASGLDSFGGGLTGEQQLYNAGKAVYAQKLGCGNCTLAGKKLDKALAQGVLSDAALSAHLDDDERGALAAYLKLRFKL